MKNNNSLYISNIAIGEYDIRIDFNVVGEWSKFFIKDNITIVYSEKIIGTPKSIAIIPFLCNVIPLAWLCDAKIEVEEIDQTFFECLEDIKKGYQNMYPNMLFKGEICAKKIIKNIPKENIKKAVFFSGGVDAFNTLVRHIEEKPILLTVWGADVTLDDEEGWQRVSKHIEDTCVSFELGKIYIKSSFRCFINENIAEEFVKTSGDGWWHGFQHGIGLLGHGAPLAYTIGLEKIYIASTFSRDLKGQYTCASDPTIDNCLRFSNCMIIHDAYEVTRQEKVQQICEYTKSKKKRILLRVCWQENGGGNCCKCEKCYRTIMEILSEGYDPKMFGFEWNKKAIGRARKELLYHIRLSQMHVNAHWKPIQEKMKKNPDKFKEYKWFMSMDLDKFNTYFFKRINNTWLCRGICKRVRKIVLRNEK